jgi:endogenous inhibitor of DNA gyrase (YacG/DUF329 family)
MPKLIVCEYCGKLVSEEEVIDILNDNGEIMHSYCSERCMEIDYFGEDEDNDYEDDCECDDL